VLVVTLDRVLRLLHPLVPFVTSALWDRLPWPGGTGAEAPGAGENRAADLMVAPWPCVGELPRDPDAEDGVAALQELVTLVRSIRKEYGVPEGGPVELALHTEDVTFRDAVESLGPQLARLARVETVRWERARQGTVGAHGVLTSGVEVFLPLEGLVDFERERVRLRDEIARLAGLLEGTEKKLANESFVSRAPAEVVERERDKAHGQREQLAKLQAKLDLFQGRE
jgi:valyl-tRNA synthetase